MSEDVLTALEKTTAEEEEKARSKGAAPKNKMGRTSKPIP